MEKKLVLKHENGNFIEYEPVSFDYEITHIDQPEYYDNGEFAGYKTEHFSEIPISQIWKVFSSSTFRNQIEITELTCKMLPDKDYIYYTDLIKMFTSKTPLRCEGELTVIDEDTNTLFTQATLLGCVALSKVDNKISFRFDFMKTYI